jgi:hypothetical protein
MSLLKTVNLIKISRPGSRVKGSWVPGPETDTAFKGTVRPASGKTLELLANSPGKRNTDTITVYAPIDLDFTTADPEQQRDGDVIIWEGRRYEVQVARKYNSHPSRRMHHWELVATRAKEGEA